MIWVHAEHGVTEVNVYHIQGVPEDLPPGEYATKVLWSDWITCRDGSTSLLIVLEYVGPVDTGKPREQRGLFTFQKHPVLRAPQATA